MKGYQKLDNINSNNKNKRYKEKPECIMNKT